MYLKKINFKEKLLFREKINVLCELVIIEIDCLLFKMVVCLEFSGKEV